jgi:hypothetical protein
LPEDVQQSLAGKFVLNRAAIFIKQEDDMIKPDREKRLETLFEVAQSINSILDLDLLLNKMMDLLLENLSAERGFIMLKDRTAELSGGCEKSRQRKYHGGIDDFAIDYR